MRKLILSAGISLVVLCVFSVSSARADSLSSVEYTVTVNTTSALLTSGYIDFQFNPSSFATQSANVDVANFMTDGVLNPADPNNGTVGSVSGMLPGTVTFTNSHTTNEYTEAMTFGTTITFNLYLYGAAISNPNGTGGGTFTLDFLNSDQSGYLFTANSQNDVPVFTVDINGDGSTSASTYPSENGGPSVVSFTAPSATPEPTTILLFGSAAVVGFIKRKKLSPAR